MRLNRREQDTGIRGRGFGVRCVGIGASSKLFMVQYCREAQRGASQELLNAARFLPLEHRA